MSANSSRYICPHIPELSISFSWSNDAAIQLGQVKRSASAGCRLCALLLNVCNVGKGHSEDSMIYLTDGRSGTVLCAHEETIQELLILEDGGHGSVAGHGATSASTDSEVAFAKASRWYRQCAEEHGNCRSYQGVATPLPHRILDLEPGNSLGIVLRENTDCAPYVCLSHSWGGQQPLKTTTHSLQDFKRNIPWDSLPKLFKDAVAYTKRLGFRYLWIDSLCIIQDDHNDWMEQSALMADIYRHGAITLAAAVSTGPHDTLFRRLDPSHRYQGIGSEHPDVHRRTPLAHDPDDCPLLSRGWVLQERLLSARVLYFGKQELSWGCMETTDCECGGAKETGDGHLRIKSMFQPHTLHTLESTKLAAIWRNWIILLYSQLKLTVETDLLPALSGIAKAVARALRAKQLPAYYIAGMWECWFIEDCLWYVVQPSSARRPQSWRTPSFSWGSIKSDGGAHIRFMHDRLLESEILPMATLVKYQGVRQGADEMGPLQSAFAVLSGPLYHGTLRQGDLGYVGHYYNIELSEPFGLVIFSHPDYDVSFPGPHHIAEDSPVSCLHLVSAYGDLYTHEFFLVLREVQANQSEEVMYERIGLLEIANYSPSLGFDRVGELVRII